MSRITPREGRPSMRTQFQNSQIHHSEQMLDITGAEGVEIQISAPMAKRSGSTSMASAAYGKGDLKWPTSAARTTRR